MGLLPDSASFEEQVADYFVALRGRGLMLSALDAELLSAWAEVGVPFEVVARGLRRAAERASHDARPGEPPLSTLRSCRRDVEAEIKKHLARSAGQGAAEAPAPPRRSVPEERVAKLRSELRKLGQREAGLASMAERLREALGAIAAPDDLVALGRLEELVLASLLRALPFDRRLAVLGDARRRRGEAGGLTARARKLAMRVHRAAALRATLQLPAFW